LHCESAATSNFVRVEGKRKKRKKKREEGEGKLPSNTRPSLTPLLLKRGKGKWGGEKGRRGEGGGRVESRRPYLPFNARKILKKGGGEEGKREKKRGGWKGKTAVRPPRGLKSRPSSPIIKGWGGERKSSGPPRFWEITRDCSF